MDTPFDIMLFHHNPQTRPSRCYGCHVPGKKGGLAEESNLTQSHWEQNWDVNGPPRPLAVCCPSVLPDAASQGNDDTCSEMLGEKE